MPSFVDADAITRAVDAILDDATIPLDAKERELDRILSEIHLPLAKVRASRNMLVCPAVRLPLETIARILCFVSVHRTLDHLLAASLVCRRWAETAADPRVWSDIYIMVRVHEDDNSWLDFHAGTGAGGHCVHDVVPVSNDLVTRSTLHRLAPLLVRTASAPVRITLRLDAHCRNELDKLSAADIRRAVCGSFVPHPASGIHVKGRLEEMFPGHTNPMIGLLTYLSGAADRLTSLDLTIACCSSWIFLLICLPPMTALKSLILTMRVYDSSDLRQILAARPLWKILQTASEHSLRASFPALEILKVSGMTAQMDESSASRCRISQTRLADLLCSLPNLKELDLSPRLCPIIDCDDTAWYNKVKGRKPKVSPRSLSVLSKLVRIRLCSQSSHADTDSEAFSRILDVLPMNPGCSLHAVIYGRIAQSDGFLTLFKRNNFCPVKVAVKHLPNGTYRPNMFWSEICAEDDAGSSRSLCALRRGAGFDVFRWTGRRLRAFLDTAKLRSLIVYATAWNEFMKELVVPCLENLTVVLSVTSLEDMTRNFHPRALHAPALRAISFTLYEYMDIRPRSPDSSELVAKCPPHRPQRRPVSVPLNVVVALLQAVYKPSVGKIEKVTISTEMRLVPDSDIDSLKEFCHSVVWDSNWERSFVWKPYWDSSEGSGNSDSDSE